MYAAAAPWQPADSRLPCSWYREDASPPRLENPSKGRQATGLSPFPSAQRRLTEELASQRNDLVAELAVQVFIAHAAATWTENRSLKLEADAREIRAGADKRERMVADCQAKADDLGRRAEEAASDAVRYWNSAEEAVLEADGLKDKAREYRRAVDQLAYFHVCKCTMAFDIIQLSLYIYKRVLVCLDI